jgi:hypothetical protein
MVCSSIFPSQSDNIYNNDIIKYESLTLKQFARELSREVPPSNFLLSHGTLHSFPYKIRKFNHYAKRSLARGIQLPCTKA